MCWILKGIIRAECLPATVFWSSSRTRSWSTHSSLPWSQQRPCDWVWAMESGHEWYIPLSDLVSPPNNVLVWLLFSTFICLLAWRSFQRPRGRWNHKIERTWVSVWLHRLPLLLWPTPGQDTAKDKILLYKATEIVVISDISLILLCMFIHSCQNTVPGVDKVLNKY